MTDQSEAIDNCELVMQVINQQIVQLQQDADQSKLENVRDGT